MESIARLALLAVAALLAMASPVAAHPHVFVTVKSEILFAPDGKMSGIRHAWTFDESYSAMATMGLKGKEKGKFTREELDALTQINVVGLKDYDYFTYLNEKPADFSEPRDSYFSYDKGLLTLHFTLMLQAPSPVSSLALEVYDQEYFIDFQFAGGGAVSLVNAPSGCRAAFAAPKDPSMADGKRLSEQTFQDSSVNWGQQFAGKVMVTC